MEKETVIRIHRKTGGVHIFIVSGELLSIPPNNRRIVIEGKKLRYECVGLGKLKESEVQIDLDERLHPKKITYYLDCEERKTY